MGAMRFQEANRSPAFISRPTRPPLSMQRDPAPADYPFGGPGNEQRSRLISGGRARKPGAERLGITEQQRSSSPHVPNHAEWVSETACHPRPRTSYLAGGIASASRSVGAAWAWCGLVATKL